MEKDAMNDVVITAALRTAVGKFNGSIAKLPAANLVSGSSRQDPTRAATPRKDQEVALYRECVELRLGVP
jgi:hypothetical protein